MYEIPTHKSLNPANLSPSKIGKIVENRVRKARAAFLPEDGWVETHGTCGEMLGRLPSFLQRTVVANRIRVATESAKTRGLPVYLWHTDQLAVAYFHPLVPTPREVTSSKGQILGVIRGSSNPQVFRTSFDDDCVTHLKHTLRFHVRSTIPDSELEACWKALRTPQEARFRESPLGRLAQWESPVEYSIPLSQHDPSGRMSVLFRVHGTDRPLTAVTWQASLRDNSGIHLPVGPTPRCSSPQKAWATITRSLRKWVSAMELLETRMGTEGAE